MSNTRTAIGIDLGGTRIKAGVAAEDGAVLLRRTIDTQADQGPDHVIGRIVDVARELMREMPAGSPPPIGLGIGAPGALSQSRGIVHSPPNLPGWREVPIVYRLRTVLGLPALLENDANAAAMGEQWIGAGRGADDVVLLTLGTGVGSGVILGGHLLRGHFETGGEIGHTILYPGGRLCRCGQKGCLERYTSATAMAQRVIEAIETGERSLCADVLAKKGCLDAHDVEKALTAGDDVARRVWDEACRDLAIACVNIQHTLNPQIIILAGGMAAAGELLLRPVREHFLRETWPNVSDKPEFRLAALGNDAGLIGAAYLVLHGI